MAKTKEIAPQQYADWKGCSVQYIHKILQDGEIDKLDYVKSVKKYSRFYTLEVPASLTASSFIVIKRKKVS